MLIVTTIPLTINSFSPQARLGVMGNILIYPCLQLDEEKNAKGLVGGKTK